MVDEELLRAIGGMLDQKLDPVNQRLDSIDQKLDTLTQRVDVLDQRMDTLTQRVDIIDQRLDTLTQRVDVIDQRLDTLTQRVDVIDQRLDTLDDRFDTLEDRVETGFKEIRMQFKRNKLDILRQTKVYIHESEDAILNAIDDDEKRLYAHINNKLVHVS